MLQAIDVKGRLTDPLGIQLAELPLYPTIGKMVKKFEYTFLINALLKYS